MSQNPPAAANSGSNKGAAATSHGPKKAGTLDLLLQQGNLIPTPAYSRCNSGGHMHTWGREEIREKKRKTLSSPRSSKMSWLGGCLTVSSVITCQAYEPWAPLEFLRTVSLMPHSVNLWVKGNSQECLNQNKTHEKPVMCPPRLLPLDLWKESPT